MFKVSPVDVRRYPVETQGTNRLLSSVKVQVYTALATKVVPQKCKSVRNNADWYYG